MLGRFVPSDTEQTLEVLSETQSEPVVDWNVLEESGAIEKVEVESDGVVAVSEESNTAEDSAQSQDSGANTAVIEVRYQNQSAQIDPAAMGVSRAAEITNEAGNPSFVMEYGEAELNSRLLPSIESEMPPELDGQLILDGIDLVPGGMSILGQIDTGFIGQQPLNITIVVGDDQKSLEIIGVNIGGFPIETVGIAPLEEALTEAENQINQGLSDVIIIASDGTDLPLKTIYLGDNLMQVVFEN